MPASYRFVVSGRVQGVGFRYATQQMARRLGLGGWVRNRSDGAVEGVAGGDADALGRFRDWLGQGPPAARVTAVEWAEADDAAAATFEVRR